MGYTFRGDIGVIESDTIVYSSQSLIFPSLFLFFFPLSLSISFSLIYIYFFSFFVLNSAKLVCTGDKIYCMIMF